MCGEGGNLSTRDLSFIYVSSAGRVGCEFLHPLQTEEALSPISIPWGSQGVHLDMKHTAEVLVVVSFSFYFGGIYYLLFT